MMKAAKYLLWVGILAALVSPAFAETRTISWDPVVTYTDSTPIETGITVLYTAYWATDSGLGSLHAIGTSIATTSATFDPDVQGMTRGGTVYFTAKAVLSTGEQSALSPAFGWVVPSATPAPAVLSSVAVSGPSSVNEGATGTYTATATWDNGTTAAVIPAWSENSSYATISAGGLLTASAVTSNQAVTVTATYGGKTVTKGVTIVDVPAALSSVAVSGPSSVNESATGTYTATATWDNGTKSAVTPTWNENSSYATISAGGLLTASAVTSNQTVTVTATYGGKTATMSVTIVDVLASPPSAPKNIGISGPVTLRPAETWRIGWDPVDTYADGTPLASGYAVRYTAYWTDDPALSPASLRTLASSISGTSLDFDPTVDKMLKNQEIFLTVQAFLDTGDSSSLSEGIPWRVSNAGPGSPAKGKITKK